MSSFSLNQQSSTLGLIVITSGILTCSTLPIESHKSYQNDLGNKDIYTLNSSTSTFSEYSQLTNFSFNSLVLMPEVFEQIVSNFYSTLLEKQETLGKEFEEVLFNNLWDLYED